MRWLLPSALGIAAAAAVATVALHFISRRRPIAEPLPTARFIPPRAVHARVAARAFSDPWLLALRALAILLLGAAVAAPIARSSRGRIGRVIVIDRSRAVASLQELRDSALAVARPGDLIVVADSAAAPLTNASNLAALATTSAPGSLSAALAGGIAAAASIGSGVDSVQMVLISPLAQSELDAASPAIRATWPARIRVVPLRVAVPSREAARATVRADSNDALLAAATLDGLTAMRASESTAPTRLVRSAPDSTDIVWARGPGHVLVQWPSDAAPSGWGSRAPGTDSVSAVVAGGDAVVGTLRRPWRLPPLQPSQRVVARWIDGEPAAVETPFGGGCVRQVSIAFDEHADIALRAPFRRLLSTLIASCGVGQPLSARAADSSIAMLRGAPHASASVPSARLASNRSTRSPVAPWLLAVGALLLIGEMALRRSPRRSAA